MIFRTIDALDANETWGFNCGPAAICAAVDSHPMLVRAYLGDFEKKRYMNPTMIEQTLTRMRAPFQLTFKQATKKSFSFPAVKNGIARVQFEGPWMQPGVPAGARYRHTHYVAMRFGSAEVFDINSWNTEFGYVKFDRWANDILPSLMANIKRCSGTWFITHVWEIQPAAKSKS